VGDQLSRPNLLAEQDRHFVDPPAELCFQRGMQLCPNVADDLLCCYPLFAFGDLDPNLCSGQLGV
jgi:hypothetical protein